jgi:hypothetical protein
MHCGGANAEANRFCAFCGRPPASAGGKVAPRNKHRFLWLWIVLACVAYGVLQRAFEHKETPAEKAARQADNIRLSAQADCHATLENRLAPSDAHFVNSLSEPIQDLGQDAGRQTFYIISTLDTDNVFGKKGVRCFRLHGRMQGR